MPNPAPSTVARSACRLRPAEEVALRFSQPSFLQEAQLRFGLDSSAMFPGADSSRAR